MDAFEQLLLRLAAAGVAEPSTLVIEFIEDRSSPGLGFRLATAMSSRVRRAEATGVGYHPAGLVDGYVTYEVPVLPIHSSLERTLQEFSSVERLALGLRLGVESLTAQDVPVRRFAATGGALLQRICDRNRPILQTIADVLGGRLSIRVVESVEVIGRRVLDASAEARKDGRAYSRIIHDVSGHDNPLVIRRNLDEARNYDALIRTADDRS